MEDEGKKIGLLCRSIIVTNLRLGNTTEQAMRVGINGNDMNGTHSTDITEDG